MTFHDDYTPFERELLRSLDSLRMYLRLVLITLWSVCLFLFFGAVLGY